MFVESLNAASTAITALDLATKANRALPTLPRLWNLLKNGELQIVIFGAGGTGKSTLGKILSGEWDPFQLLPIYRESYRIERSRLDSDIIGSVIVVPGQERRPELWDDLLRRIIQGKVTLVINVVSWGYHSLRLSSYTDYEFYRQGMLIDEFLEEYTERQRKIEMQLFAEIVPSLSLVDPQKKKLSLLTLVTKQDLWWNERLQVEQYYEQGEYANQVQVIRNRLGLSSFTHQYCSASLVMQNVISKQNELLIPTTQGYDEILKLLNLQSLLSIIESLCSISLRFKDEL